jgi:hypothetical protein
MQADRYEIQVEPEVADQARRLLAELGSASAGPS